MENFKNSDCKILIVDDLPQNIQILGSTLRNSDYKVEFALNANDALDWLEQGSFDLILLDVMMPNISGFDVCKMIKSKPETAKIPIIFLTAKNDKDSILKGFELGAADYIIKPFHPKELLARVNTHLELNYRRAQLEESIAIRNKFFSIVAHDLKNPFSAMLTSADIVSEYFDQLPKEKLKVKIGLLVKSIKHVVNFSLNLLEWARAQTGIIRFNPELIALQDLFDEVLDILENQIINKKITISKNIIDEKIIADNNMLSSILRNLISNAIKYTHTGGIVEISAEQTGKYITFKVKDDGVGIKEGDLHKLFRLDAKHTTPGTNNETGSGLGLLLCKEFIEKHGGEICVKSKAGNGTEFSFTLPVK